MQGANTANRVGGLTLRQAALTAGLAYVLNPVTFSEFYAMPHLFGSDPAQTVAHIAAHPHLFAAAILAYLFSLAGDVVLAWSLYVLLAPVNRALSLLAAVFQLVYAAVALAAVTNLGLLYRLILIPDYHDKISAVSLPEQTVLALGGFRAGFGLGLVLFGMHLVVLGWLVAHSTYVPRWLGWMLFVNGWAYVVDSVSLYVAPGVPLGFLTVFMLPEIGFMVWLLGWGRNLPELRAT